jgi:predicted DNA-binding transcriptional regulator AlpA
VTTSAKARPTRSHPGPRSHPDDELLTVAQMCAELGGISRRTFYRWREIGVGPHCIKIPNGELRVWRSDFAAWLDSLPGGPP